MKILFLDIDGVLNCLPAEPERRWADFRKNDERAFGLNRELVQNLKNVLAETDAMIVVTSSWRHFDDYAPFRPKEQWRDVLAGMMGRSSGELFLGDTPSLASKKMDDEGTSEYSLRGKEIRAWLDENKDRLPDEIGLCVVDDEVIDIIGEIDKRFVVHVDRNVGLTEEVTRRVVAVLNGQVWRLRRGED